VLSSDLQAQMKAAEDLTVAHRELRLNVAMNYSGQWDIVQAARELISEIQKGSLSSDDVNEVRFAQHLSLSDIPPPDLFIRTSGEQRISNFFLWQLAYTELYFLDTYWPDFNADEFEKALLSFSVRERRYGQTSKQLSEGTC
jgi:undecaprenyl diphosphate synthase